MKEIPLTKGYIALVDDEDFPRLCGYNYWAVESIISGNLYIYGRRWLPRVRGNGDSRISIALHYDVLQIEPQPGILIDHINRNTLDTQKHNLRITDKQGNAQNSDRVENAKGIYYDSSRDRYKAFRLFGDGTRQYIGTYKTKQEAEAARRLFIEEDSHTNYSYTGSSHWSGKRRTYKIY